MSVRLRGMAMRRMITSPDEDRAHSTIAEDAIVDELENGTHFGGVTLSP